MNLKCLYKHTRGVWADLESYGYRKLPWWVINLSQRFSINNSLQTEQLFVFHWSLISQNVSALHGRYMYFYTQHFFIFQHSSLHIPLTWKLHRSEYPPTLLIVLNSLLIFTQQGIIMTGWKQDTREHPLI